ncbi:branched-chain amino acid transaminase [Halosegnis rubeus]|jgi:branched-chain amino acid aminotransferase|uniref:Branched-chain-amino-acid aminotransferase n=1 Tax=Halosegnis rubeus TaxID=2212850 RepID=A0A5N5U1W0_9EURY|nr:branched-chain amino acid transaminase [Halosegnis rubeus]KAB7512524.1 branched-chain amino acid transaminase [Halosegnis rubeus]KAB7514459.1 branched-chain amino acid transaminase [Halosegnis rubeus]KAB7517851.1 branched-chain amino acid transaminase [Halosegnis rubeus]
MSAFEAMEDDGVIWQNGEFVDWRDATTHVLSHGLHYGSGVFEGVRAYDTQKGTALFRWEEHLDRLYESTKPYDMDIEHDREELTEATLELLDRNELESAYIRPIAFYGYDSLGVSPKDCPTDVAIAAWEWGAYLGEEALKNGIDVMVSSWRKHASSQIPTNAKTTGLYVNSMLAGEEARRNGFVEAIVLNKEGNVAEGPGENIFLVRDDEIFTPGLSESILDGITRETVITLAEERGYTVHDNVSISRGELHTADELFFTGSAAEVTPIKQVDNVTIGSGTRGPVTEELQTAFFDLVERKTDDHDEWFTYV